jgi:hypothetical protein
MHLVQISMPPAIFSISFLGVFKFLRSRFFSLNPLFLVVTLIAKTFQLKEHNKIKYKLQLRSDGIGVTSVPLLYSGSFGNEPREVGFFPGGFRSSE